MREFFPAAIEAFDDLAAPEARELLGRAPEPDQAARLSRQPGRPLVKYGTTRLTRTLLEHGLIDEFQFSILPVRVGNGRRLFAELDGPTRHSPIAEPTTGSELCCVLLCRRAAS